jgi:alpha-tubulin suppressor-like RCC1 family protein
MRRSLVRFATLAVAIAPWACADSEPIAPTPVTTLSVGGTVSDFDDPSRAIPGAHFFFAEGGGTIQGNGFTDEQGHFSFDLELTTPCEASATILLEVEAGDYLSLSESPLGFEFALECANEPQTVDVSLYRLIFRDPQAVAGSAGASHVSSGRLYSCALGGGGASCWGRMSWEPPLWAASPMPVAETQGFSKVTLGEFHGCGLDGDGVAWCWGANAFGVELPDPSAEPRRIEGDQRFVDLSAGAIHNCGLTVEGEVWCWGDERRLGAGLAGGDYREIPVRASLDGRVVQLSAEYDHTCAVLESGDLWCWGLSWKGELGAGETEGEHTTPARVVGDQEWAAVDVGSNFTCGLTSGGEAWCWGRGGPLGTGKSPADHSTPQRVAAAEVYTAISAGGDHACALTAGGAAHCWGMDWNGAVGVTLTGDQLESIQTPTAMTTDLRFLEVQAGGQHTCGITTDEEMVCWGRREYLGSGRTLLELD